MSLKQDLLKARSYLSVILGFLLAFGIVFYVEKNTPPADIKIPQLQLSDNFPNLPTPRELDYNEAIWARIAWQYFINNTQSSGLVNTAEGLPYTTLWDSASYLMAMVSAHQLAIIDDHEFDVRMQKALNALGSLPLYQEKIPYLYYSTTELKPAPTAYNVDYSLIDLGRLLMAFKVIIWRYPQYNALVKQTVRHWNLATLFNEEKDNSSLKSRHNQTYFLPNDYRSGYGYALYSKNGLSLTNTWAGIVLDTSKQPYNFMSMNGLNIPKDGVLVMQEKPYPIINSLPYILTGLENGFNTESAEISWNIIQAQENLNQNAYRHSYVNMGFSNNLPLLREDKSKTGVSVPNTKDGAQLQNKIPMSLSTQVAFGWYALFSTPWTEQVRTQASTLFIPGKGWLDGIEASNQQPSTLITATTNAVILESLMYVVQGKMVCLACQNTELASAAQPSESQ